MHVSSDTRLIRCLDGLDMSFAMLENIHAELYPTCAAIKADQRHLVLALWRCWSFVDAVHRIREIAQAVPGLSKKTAEVRSFLDATSIAEDFRHYIQHLRSELSKTPGNTFPVWGSLSWVDLEDQWLTHIAMAGARVGETRYVGCVFDRVKREWVSKVALSVNDLSFNFDPIFKHCTEFRDFVIPRLLGTYSLGINVREELPLMSVRLQFGEARIIEQSIEADGNK
jgi:hypothetical protein